MASSSSSDHHRPQRPIPLARHNSSFLGTIKSIVTAPLTWFGQQEEADDGTRGKRRRAVEQAPTEPVVPLAAREQSDEVEEATRRSKRMRLQSPPRTKQPYLDPPANAVRRSNSLRRGPAVPRASSAVLPSSRASRATVSPLRHVPLQRTMSIDPPYRAPATTARRDTLPAAPFNFGSDMDMILDVDRDDVSMPPSPRPSFRMRASLTPQPQHLPARHISEPPPLNALVSNPVFLHPPVLSQEPAPAPTLGSLVESARATRSPVRQHHSSLLFSSNTALTNNENKDAPAERALQQLDIYKTPLLPTRMRSSNLPTSVTARTTPDMFKSRRSSRLVLMQDDRDHPGRKVSGTSKSSLVNETKPYAGEGGMKKLLARHKLDVDKDEDDAETTEETTPRIKQPSPPPAASTSMPPPPPAGSDWFSTAVSGSSSSTAGSSLRVGRTKTSRNHIQRPSRPNKFSAAFDDDVDDAMEDDDSRKDRQMLEEAAKKVPVFSIPAGFSFAKDTPAPVQATEDLEKAKEPPITALPYSFLKSATPTPRAVSPEPPKVDNTPKLIPPALTFSAPTPTSSSTLAPPARAPSPESKPSATAVPSFFSIPPKVPAAVPSTSGIPNFFANSQVLKETPLPTPPPVLNFGATTTTTSTTPSAAPFSFAASPSVPVKPVKDTDNPFWIGETKKVAVEERKSTSNLFEGTVSAFPHTNKASTETSSLPFSFGKSAEEKPAALKTAPTDLPFSFGAPTEQKQETITAAPIPLFGATSNTGNLFGEAPKPATSLFNEPPKSSGHFGASAPPPPQSTPSPLSFNFGPSSSTTSTSAPAEAPKSPFAFGSSLAPSSPAVEAPKPLFGGRPITFGQPAAAEKEKEEVKSTPFSFGAAPSTPPTAPATDPKPAPTPFSFGQPTAPAPSAAAFSFSGGGSAGADVSNKQPFMFGQSSSAAPMARPVTPPKSYDQEFRMEESPTREMQQVNAKPFESRPTIGGGPFSFGGASSATSGFGGGQSSAPASAPFSFGNSQPSNPFAAKDKPEEPKGFSGFGQPSTQVPQITTSFSFGGQKEEARPSSAGAFSFGTTPTSTTNQTAPFSFGASSSGFGQPTSSAPSSPSTFNQQPSPFGFGAPAPAAFSFGGSQPASPAAGAHLTLPQPINTGFGGGGGGFGQSVSPSSPFSGPIPLTPSTSGGGGGGGSLFTVGAAPSQQPGGGPRQIRKLPRRGGAPKR